MLYLEKHVRGERNHFLFISQIMTYLARDEQHEEPKHGKRNDGATNRYHRLEFRRNSFVSGNRFVKLAKCHDLVRREPIRSSGA